MLKTIRQSPIKSQPTAYLANVFNALADPTRLRLINLLLKHNDKCVSEYAAMLKVSVSAVSQNFRILELNDLVVPQRQGQKICYRLRLEDPFVKAVINFVKQT